MARYPKYYVRPDGLHETILRINGKRKAFRGKTDKEVWEKVKAFDREADRIETEKAAVFEKIADAWWAEIEPTLEHNTQKSYRPALARAKKEFAGRPPGEITAKEIDQYIKDFSATHARKTVVTQLQIIRQIFRKAEQIELIKKGAGLPFGLFAFLVYYTGCRRGEALALTGADIDRKKNLVHIKKSVYHVGNSPHIKQPKSDAGCRDVPLLPALAKLLPKKLGRGYLFAEPDGGLLTNDHFTSLYDAYRDASGVTVTAHQIRHGYATALLESGVDPKTAQVLLGHAQLSTTMDIYTHVRDGQLKAAAEKMEKGF